MPNETAAFDIILFSWVRCSDWGTKAHVLPVWVHEGYASSHLLYILMFVWQSFSFFFFCHSLMLPVACCLLPVARRRCVCCSFWRFFSLPNTIHSVVCTCNYQFLVDAVVGLEMLAAEICESTWKSLLLALCVFMVQNVTEGKIHWRISFLCLRLAMPFFGGFRFFVLHSPVSVCRTKDSCRIRSSIFVSSAYCLSLIPRSSDLGVCARKFHCHCQTQSKTHANASARIIMVFGQTRFLFCWFSLAHLSFPKQQRTFGATHASFFPLLLSMCSRALFFTPVRCRVFWV